jgi:hypothetical protein
MMEKQKIAFLLSLAWLVGMLAFFSFPPAAKIAGTDPATQAKLRSISAPDMHFSISDHSPEVPAFKANLNISSFLSTTWSVAFIPPLRQYLSSSFFTKSRAKFDVLSTFFYFFHTW